MRTSIGHDDSFFDLGGDSITVAQLAMLCTKSGLKLGLQDVIDCPTLKTQVLLILGQMDGQARRDPPKLVLNADESLT